MPGGAPQGYTGQMSFGGATFSLAIDAGHFDQELKRAESAARQASKKIGQNLGRGGDAAMGLLYLGQAVDDLQYGFRSVVNNIPTLVTAMGGGAGLAGAVGIVAVAINQVVTHLDELKAAAEMSPQMQQLIGQIEDLAAAIDKVGKSASGGAAGDWITSLLSATAGAGGLAGAVAGVGKVNKALKALGMGASDRAAGARYASEKAAADAAGKDIARVAGAAQEERAKLFSEAMKQYGGGPKLEQEVAERLMNGNPALDVGRATTFARLKIQSAMQGNDFAPGSFGMGFEKVHNKLAWDKDTDKLNKLGEALEKLTPGLHKDWATVLKAEGEANERRMLAGLMAERDAKSQQVRTIREQMESMQAPKSFGSMRDYLSSVTVGGADNVRKQQLERLRGIEKGVDKLNEQIKSIQQARFQ